MTVENTNAPGRGAEAARGANSKPKGTLGNGSPQSRKALPQQISTTRQPAGERAQGAPDHLGRLFERMTTKLAQDDGNAIFLGQSAQFLDQIVGAILAIDFGCFRTCRLRFHSPAPLPQRPGLQGGLERDPVEPVADQGPRNDGIGLAKQDQEGSLKGILGVCLMIQDATACAKDHRAVSAEQCFKGSDVVLGDEALHQVRVSTTRQFMPESDLVKHASNAVASDCGHGPGASFHLFIYLFPRPGRFYPSFRSWDKINVRIWDRLSSQERSGPPASGRQTGGRRGGRGLRPPLTR